MPKKKEAKVKKGVNSLELAKKAIVKKYGSIIGKMSEQGELHIQTIPTGSLGLDIALGRGGVAKGRIYELFGEPSCGKTTLAMSIMAQAQQRGMKCCFCDAEHAADPKLFKAMGVNIDDVELIRAFSGDDNLDAVETLVKTGEIDVAVVDSVSALIPRAEANSAIADEHIGLLARLMSKAMRRFSPLASETNTLIIFINQIRTKIGSWGDPTTTTGGSALDFYATGRIQVSGGAFKNQRIVDPITGDVIGHKTTFDIKKNKLAPPYRKAQVPLIYGVGYDIHREVLVLSEGLGLIEKRGAYFYHDDDNFAQGEENAVDFLRENDDFYNGLRDKIIEMTGLKEQYEQNSG